MEIFFFLVTEYGDICRSKKIASILSLTTTQSTISYIMNHDLLYMKNNIKAKLYQRCEPKYKVLDWKLKLIYQFCKQGLLFSLFLKNFIILFFLERVKASFIQRHHHYNSKCTPISRQRERQIQTKKTQLWFSSFKQKQMAFSFLKTFLIIIFISLLSPCLSSSLPSSPTISPFQQLSPEIAPLLPSPGDALPSGDGGGTIPSSPSPPDPDTNDGSYPDPFAFAPFASPPPSSPAPPSQPPAVVLLLSIIVSSASLRLCGVVTLLQFTSLIH